MRRQSLLGIPLNGGQFGYSWHATVIMSRKKRACSMDTKYKTTTKQKPKTYTKTENNISWKSVRKVIFRKICSKKVDCLKRYMYMQTGICLPLAHFSSFRSPNKGNRITSGKASSLSIGLLTLEKPLAFSNAHRKIEILAISPPHSEAITTITKTITTITSR